MRKFVVETLRDLAHPSGDQSKFVELTSQLHRWELRYRNLSPAPLPKRIHVLRALPARVIEELYALFKPNSADNPFRSEAQRWQNMAILLCLLHQDLRRGEVLLLPFDVIRSRSTDRSASRATPHATCTKTNSSLPELPTRSSPTASDERVSPKATNSAVPGAGQDCEAASEQ
ncbi:hypothetical protein [Maricaulis virginensis]|uniref:hypothetical protein n=1 Tax=Maricaulis virginensis TaxID=144022 RepID=UPI0022F28357|nr:hypothetical protein [Maricaulis virginensis]